MAQHSIYKASATSVVAALHACAPAAAAGSSRLGGLRPPMAGCSGKTKEACLRDQYHQSRQPACPCASAQQPCTRHSHITHQRPAGCCPHSAPHAARHPRLTPLTHGSHPSSIISGPGQPSAVPVQPLLPRLQQAHRSPPGCWTAMPAGCVVQPTCRAFHFPELAQARPASMLGALAYSHLGSRRHVHSQVMMSSVGGGMQCVEQGRYKREQGSVGMR